MRRLVFFCLLSLAAACLPSADPSARPPALVFTEDTAWPHTSTYPGLGAGRLVITNSYEDSLSIFDAAQLGQPGLTELRRVPIGLDPIAIEAPHHLAAAPSGEFIYPLLSNYAPGSGTGPHGAHGTGTLDGYLLKLSTADHRLLAQTRVDRNPGDLAISHDGKSLAITHFDLKRIESAARGETNPNARLILVNAETFERRAAFEVCPAPHGVAFSPDDKRIYVACFSDEVAVVDLTAAEPTVKRVKVAPDAGDAFLQKYQPYSVTVSPLTGDVFVGCLASNEVRVLKAADLQFDFARTVRLSGAPYLSSFSPDGRKLWVPTQGDDALSEVDPMTGAVLRKVALPPEFCRNVHQTRLTHDGQSVLVICEGIRPKPGTLLVFNVAGLNLISHTDVGLFPDYVTLIP